MIRRLASLALLVVAVHACRCDGPPAGEDAGPSRAPLILQKATAASADPIADVAARSPARPGHCAQVKSLREETEAEAVAESIRTALSLPVEIVKADLGERGTWWRICVGAEETDARLVALATRWTSPGGELEPFLDAATDGAPRFFLHSRTSAEARRAEAAQARAITSFQLVEGAPALFFGGPARETLAVASTALVEGAVAQGGASDVIAVDPAGRILGFDDKPAPGCSSCALALQEGSVRARRAVAAGDTAPNAGEELLVEEETDKGVRILSVLSIENGALHRVASLVLENARAGFVQTGRAGLVEADADAHKEIVLSSTELRVQGDAACALERHAAVYDLPATSGGLVRLDPLKVSAETTASVTHVIAALDAWGDHDAASRACAAHLAREPQAATTQLCLQRVRRLLDDGALIDAVNAAGLVAEASATLRPLLAASFHDAASRLDADPRLFAGELDCAKSPLVDQLPTRSLEETIRLATARAQERVALADVVDAVFVTGARDFGPESPVGQVTARWLERAKVALPARYAAIEALLLPQAPESAPETAAASESSDAGPGFGGAP